MGDNDQTIGKVVKHGRIVSFWTLPSPPALPVHWNEKIGSIVNTVESFNAKPSKPWNKGVFNQNDPAELSIINS